MAARIEKAPETMTSRERVKRTFEFEKTDRVTIGYDTNEAIHAKFSRALGIDPANCIVFEDAEAGIEAAIAGGMKCVGIGDPARLNRANAVIPGLFKAQELDTASF